MITSHSPTVQLMQQSDFINGETNEYYIGCDYVKVTKDNAQEILDMVK